MGGYGSGYTGIKKYAVEECFVLSAKDFKKWGGFLPGRSGTLTWSCNGEKSGSISYQTGESEVTLIYTANGVPMRYPVQIWDTSPTYGGIRHYFLCPLVGCKSFKVDKLYLPPTAKYFGCRLCYKLTYQSCRESHQFAGLFRQLAAGTGFTPQQMEKAVKRMYK